MELITYNLLMNSKKATRCLLTRTWRTKETPLNQTDPDCSSGSASTRVGGFSGNEKGIWGCKEHSEALSGSAQEHGKIVPGGHRHQSHSFCSCAPGCCCSWQSLGGSCTPSAGNKRRCRRRGLKPGKEPGMKEDPFRRITHVSVLYEF